MAKFHAFTIKNDIRNIAKSEEFRFENNFNLWNTGAFTQFIFAIKKTRSFMLS